MDILPQVKMDDVNIKDNVYYYTIGKNPSHRTLRFSLEVYGIDIETLAPINIVTVHFPHVLKDVYLSIVHLAIHRVTGLKYNKSVRRLTRKKVKIWRIGE